MDGRSLEDIMQLIAKLSAEQGMSRPLRLRVEFADQADNIALPFSLIRQQTTTPRPAVRTTSASREPRDVEEAISVALFLAGVRRTGPELIDDLNQRWPDRWSDGSIANAATALARAGTLSSQPKDPGDGRGKGYGLRDWDRQQPPE